MTSSDARTLELKAHRIITRIADQLDDAQVSARVDGRLDRAATQYLAAAPKAPPMTFHETIATFVQHLYRYGLRLPRTLSREQSLAEAIFLLNASANTGGYDAARVAANYGEISDICQQITDFVKARERRNYTYWVLSTHLDACDWPMRLAIADAILGQPAWRAVGSGLQADRLAGSLDQLIIKDLETRIAATPAIRRT